MALKVGSKYRSASRTCQTPKPADAQVRSSALCRCNSHLQIQPTPALAVLVFIEKNLRVNRHTKFKSMLFKGQL